MYRLPRSIGNLQLTVTGYLERAFPNIESESVDAILIVRCCTEVQKMPKKDLVELQKNLRKMQNVPTKASIGKLAELLDRQDIDINQIGDIKKVSVY